MYFCDYVSQRVQNFAFMSLYYSYFVWEVYLLEFRWNTGIAFFVLNVVAPLFFD